MGERERGERKRRGKKRRGKKRRGRKRRGKEHDEKHQWRNEAAHQGVWEQRLMVLAY